MVLSSYNFALANPILILPRMSQNKMFVCLGLFIVAAAVVVSVVFAVVYVDVDVDIVYVDCVVILAARL